VPAYRLYFLDGTGRVQSADWVEAGDDSAAAESARQLLGKGVYAELWLGQRFVTQLNQKGATSDDAG
jgi:hypothetical protein